MPHAKPFLPLLAAAVLGGGAAAGTGALLDGDAPPASTVTVSSGQAIANTASGSQAGTTGAAQIYEGAKDAVAFITAEVTQRSSSPFGAAQSGEATGTGFVIDPSGLVVTNAHVVDGATSVKVKVGDRAEQAARVVGVDDSTDVALLDLDASGLPALDLGDSSAVTVGDPVFAIGNPYGLDRTLTTGVVSALARTIEAPNGWSISGVIQTDAALNPGNSGGPLLDGAGRVVGVNSQIASSSGGNTGVGFAVPAATVERVVAQLRADGSAEHAYLGVATGEASDEAGGATVGSVVAGGPAAEAGVQRGDRIVAVGDTRVDDPADVTAAVDAKAPGDEVRLTVERSGDRQELTVTLGERPARAS